MEYKHAIKLSFSSSIISNSDWIDMSVVIPLATDFFNSKALVNNLLHYFNISLSGINTGINLASPVVQWEVELIKLSTYIAANLEFIKEIR